MEWISTGEAALRLGIDHREVYRLIAIGELSAAKGTRPLPPIVVAAEHVAHLASQQ